MLHMSSMTNGYVRRDMNRESNFFSNAEGQEHLLMADGTAMSADAFRDAHPTTKFTPEELGMNMAASPFSESNPMVESYEGQNPVYHDEHTTARGGEASQFGLYTAKSFNAEPTAIVSGLNSWVSKNLGVLLVTTGVIFGVYRLGMSRGRNQYITKQSEYKTIMHDPETLMFRKG